MKVNRILIAGSVAILSSLSSATAGGKALQTEVPRYDPSTFGFRGQNLFKPAVRIPEFERWSPPQSAADPRQIEPEGFPAGTSYKLKVEHNDLPVHASMSGRFKRGGGVIGTLSSLGKSMGSKHGPSALQVEVDHLGGLGSPNIEVQGDLIVRKDSTDCALYFVTDNGKIYPLWTRSDENLKHVQQEAQRWLRENRRARWSR